MNTKDKIARFIKDVSTNNYKQANRVLRSIVNEKLKQRIQAADKKISAEQ